MKKISVDDVSRCLASCTRKINLIVVHCSATPEGRAVKAEDIRRWHMNDRGFSDIGYHFIVCLDGTIQSGRPLEKAGAHCRGKNANSIGVCYIGGLNTNGIPADTRTEAQKVSLLSVLRALRIALPNVPIRGHRDFAPKACPCFDATEEYSQL